MDTRSALLLGIWSVGLWLIVINYEIRIRKLERRMALSVKQCLTCKKTFESHNGKSCPHCGSSDWVLGAWYDGI